MNHFFLKLILLSALTSGIAGCSASGGSDGPAGAGGASTKFSGIFSMSMNLSAGDASDVNYQAEYTAGYNVGMRGAQTVISWCSENTDLNYAPAIYMASNAGYGLTALSAQGFKILLTIPVIAMTTKCAPPRVASDAFNTANMKAAYRAFLDQLFPYIDSNVIYISFGNEVDSYFSTHGTEWAAYQELIEDAATYVKANKPWVKVGVTTTFKGASVTYPTEVQTLNTNMDVFVLTYYPHPGNFVMNEPTVVNADMQTAVGLAGSKPLVYQEFGYPTDTNINASELKQSQFFQWGLQEWKSQGAAKIPFLSAFKRRDYQGASCGVPGTNPYRFLCSLGTVTNTQTSKQAWTTLQSTLQSIGIP